MVGCTFCDIVSGTASAHRVLDDDVAVAFLDRSPLFPGHVLVVPRAHVGTLPELPVDAVGPLFERVRRVAAAVPTATGATGTFVAANNVVSQSVPHLHVHVVPRRRGDGLRGFFWPRRRYGSDDEAAEIAARLRAAIASHDDAHDGAIAVDGTVAEHLRDTGDVSLDAPQHGEGVEDVVGRRDDPAVGA